MYFKVFDYLKSLEKQIIENRPIFEFKGYRAIHKRGVEKVIDDIYATLPEDVKNAKKYLDEQNVNFKENQKTYSSKMWDCLKEFEMALSLVLFADIIIVKINEMEKLINNIYDSIPDEIVKANEISK
jgi:GTP:adenosylcobinamide-phosphate guanylyltransferase